jgi:hypothetical protein
MSQILEFRQHWMATIRDRHICEICGVLAVSAKYVEVDNGKIEIVKWLCAAHLEETMV